MASTIGKGLPGASPLNPKSVRKAGNWYEEIILEYETGIKYYPDPRDRSKQLLTKSRCIEHTEQMHPKDYRSVTNETIGNPNTHPDNLTLLQNKTNGPRKQALENKFKAEINEKYDQMKSSDLLETRKVKYLSQNQEAFNIPGFKPKLNDGRSDNSNSNNQRIQTRNADYATDTPITYFSDTLNRSNGIDNTVSFPVSFVNSTNPFRKSSAFSADVRIEPFARKCETNERPAPMPTFVDHRALQTLRKRLILHVRRNSSSPSSPNVVPGLAVRRIVSILWQMMDRVESDFVPISYFLDCLKNEFDFDISPSECKSVLAAVDLDSSERVAIPEFVNIVRGLMSQRRLELVGIFFGFLERASSEDGSGGFVSKRAINQFFKEDFQDKVTGSLSTVLDGLGVSADADDSYSVTIDDFADYYASVSAEIEDNSFFELILRKSWNI